MKVRLPLAFALLLAGCDPRSDAGPVVVSTIGGEVALADPARGALDHGNRVLLDATAQGLVRFDAAGQIEPGLAERWIVIDHGMSYLFRLREAEWADGDKVTADEVVASLRRQIAPGSRNALLPFLSAIDQIVARTPEVIEVELKRPRPDLLKLFAQPELALFRTHRPGGSGPFRLTDGPHGHVLLRPAFDPRRSPDDDVAKPGPQDNVELIGERASRAIARFVLHQSDLVSGGTAADWPLLAAAGVAPANRRIDPAMGLFGWAVVDRSGFLADAANRAAVARAIDRQAIVAAFGTTWPTTNQILPEALDSATPPAQPAWATVPAATTANPVATWRAAHPGDIRLRLAVPAGPGGTLVFGLTAANLHTLGIIADRVAWDASADLRLIDAVAPYDSARWYLATACQLCSPEAQTALDGARDAPTMALRAQHLAEADAALASDVAFIPIAQPLRWSLVSLRLKQWQPNARAWHPLNRLRGPTN
ncbi:MAG: transporter substrate-binding protein [Sphingomonas bacterium]|uniref:ABC transporter substrate-binding protein n=1 Tax=Sphingomonas bacterium TaxID=1895847 RepID=UPI002636F6F0|nr:ABC transporter substrate-binding protein [Sphingomonas bacterium]MDB5709641.1 transporter substrate-binding protein [Sphingomonas bacterium]